MDTQLRHAHWRPTEAFDPEVVRGVTEDQMKHLTDIAKNAVALSEHMESKIEKLP